MMTQCETMCKRCRHGIVLGAMLVVGMIGTACSGYDLDEQEPEGLGASRSIYSYLHEQGNYTNMVRLIDDLNYREVLDKTGSKTLFVADDAAYDRFFSNNSWGVRNYSQLTTSQKKLR